MSLECVWETWQCKACLPKTITATKPMIFASIDLAFKVRARPRRSNRALHMVLRVRSIVPRFRCAAVQRACQSRASGLPADWPPGAGAVLQRTGERGERCRVEVQRIEDVRPGPCHLPGLVAAASSSLRCSPNSRQDSFHHVSLDSVTSGRAQCAVCPVVACRLGFDSHSLTAN